MKIIIIQWHFWQAHAMMSYFNLERICCPSDSPYRHPVDDISNKVKGQFNSIKETTEEEIQIWIETRLYMLSNLILQRGLLALPITFPSIWLKTFPTRSRASSMSSKRLQKEMHNFEMKHNDLFFQT